RIRDDSLHELVPFAQTDPTHKEVASMKRILIGGIVAGIIVFIWGAVAHTILPTAKMGIKQIPNEEAVLSAMKASIQEPGFYFFPGMDMSREPTPEEARVW